MCSEITNENKQEFEDFVEEVMTQCEAKGMAIAIVEQSGNIVYEHYFGYRDEEKKLPVNRDTIFGLASVTKSFTALSILQLAEDGIVDLDGEVRDYVREFTGENQKGLKLKHLLTHTGGFFPLPRIVVDAVAADMGLDEKVTGDLIYDRSFAAEGARRVASRLDDQTNLIGRPGEYLSYCNDGYGLLSDIIKNYGDEETFADYITTHITGPLGMTRSFCDFLRPSEDENAAILYTKENGVFKATRDYHDDAFVLNGGGAMKSTIADMCKYLAMYLNEGRSPEGQRIIPSARVHEMCSPKTYMSPNEYYGYGVTTKPVADFTAVGHGGSLPGVSSKMLWSYELGAGVVVLCNTMDVSVGVVAEAALRMYRGYAPRVPKTVYKTCQWDEAWIDEIAGDYVNGEGEAFTLYKKEDGCLGMVLNGREKAIVPVNRYMAKTDSQFASAFLHIVKSDERGVYAARYGSRIFPKCS